MALIQSSASLKRIKPLQNGDQLRLPEFKKLYAQHPNIRRAELIEGVVYVASPVYLPHADAQMKIITWLGVYQSKMSGVSAAGEMSIELDGENEVQPDAVMWREGDLSISDDGRGYAVGSPTLVVEIAASTAAYDLGLKKRVYQRNRVQEYLVIAIYEQEIFWFNLEDGAYQPLQPDSVGVYSSSIFQGLKLNRDAFWSGDLQKLLATLDIA